MRFNDAVFGVGLILFALAMMAYTITFPSMPGQDYGPALFPRIIGGGLIVCGLILTVSGLRAHKAGGGWSDFDAWVRDRGRLLDGALIFAALIFYILVDDWLGFIPTALIILLLLLLRFGCRPLTAVVLAVGSTLAIHALFAKLLLVPLPWGLLENYAW